MSNNYVETSTGYSSDDLVNDSDGNPNSQFRYNLLTASSTWKALKTQSTQNQLIYKKCLHCYMG